MLNSSCPLEGLSILLTLNCEIQSRSSNSLMNTTETFIWALFMTVILKQQDMRPRKGVLSWWERRSKFKKKITKFDLYNLYCQLQTYSNPNKFLIYQIIYFMIPSNWKIMDFSSQCGKHIKKDFFSINAFFYKKIKFFHSNQIH